jgi:lipoprotein-anchoring transpeptidase ErfK/SrfK
MSRRTREFLILAAGLVLVAVVAFAGLAVVHARAAGGRDRQALAAVALPATVPTQGPAQEQQQYQRWMVGKALGAVVVRRRPSLSAPVKATLGRTNQNGYPTLVLVDTVRQVAGVTWYRVYVAMRPNESRGWVREGRLAFYTTSAHIVIDLSRRRLMVYRAGKLLRTFPVAVGRPGLATPTGHFFINQKLRPPSPYGAYGVLALGISAFQPRLASWAEGGPVAIHGTNEPALIGKAVSHGCVRMHNRDVLAVNELVPAGSPVDIEQ